ncbi:MAG: hypothetical protein ONB46_13870 [candidate division KSB1 bacterium]|nr:hypothetical protein [candidate division KSB1 bacterium]MDZ7369496.1 hypothetical protein [candidate division KSB1 bacterium]MDZ7407593.1 hypothetical protein [candidate division KSB1 bacterium]
MKTVELSSNPITIEQLLEWASLENVIIRRNGEKFVVAMVDDFEAEVESLRHNDEFIAFLDARAKDPKIPIEEARKRLLEQD